MTQLLKWRGSYLPIGALLIGALASVGNAQQQSRRESQSTDEAEQTETLTEPERMLRQLEESDDKENQSLARKWQGLIRQRQWADVSGKHKIFAKYLAHDPKMEWMELLSVTRHGDQLETRRIKVAVDKFGKSERSLLKRIALIRPRVEAATAAAASDDQFGSRSPDRFDDRARDAYGRGGQYGRGEPVEEQSAGPRRSRIEPAGPIDTPPPAERREAYGSQGAATPRSVNFDPAQPNLVDSAPWRTSFDAFRQNFSARRMRDGRWSLSWGELTGLQNAFAAVLAADRARERLLRGEISQPEAVQLADEANAALVEIGEVVWETTLPTPVYGPHAHSDYGLAPLPEPFHLLLRTEEQDGGDYRAFQVGQQVQFIGRFARVMGEEDYPTIVLRIRFPASLADAQEGRETEQSYPPQQLTDEQREYGK